MSKFCQNCGTENEDTASFCKSCGSALVTANQNVNPNPQMNNMGGQPSMNNYSNPNRFNMVPNRNVAISIILCFVTCGIYLIYWFIVMTDDAKKVSNDNQGASGGVALLLSLVTCGIYGIYWQYKQGQRLYEAGKNYGLDIKDNSILYLILSLVGFGIISYALIQSDLNKFSSGN